MKPTANLLAHGSAAPNGRRPPPAPDAFGLDSQLDDDSPADAGFDAATAADAPDASPLPAPVPTALGPAASEATLTGWIDRIVDHDDRALSALYDATARRVHALVLRIVRRSAWADEVVEDVYFQVWRQAARFDPTRGQAMAWLLAMARSRALDALRHEQRFAADSLDADSSPELPDLATCASDELLAMTQTHAQLHEALMRLSAQPRQLVALAFFRGLSHEEIASQTDLPLGTVKSQIRRALSALKSAMGEQGLAALRS
jgi:RNA polymerase sigma factor (sigma-70 family)